jgi:small GTP-binding protein
MATSKVSKKICLVGDFSVGKTSLVRRFVHDLFEDKYISTIGVKVSRKEVIVPRGDGEAHVTMMLWDLAGSEEFDHVQASYMRGATGAVLVCDLTRSETLASLQAYARDLRGINPNIRFAVAANKCDLTERQQITPEQVAQAAAELDAPHYLTSAKTGDDVETLFHHLGRLLMV